MSLYSVDMFKDLHSLERKVPFVCHLVETNAYIKLRVYENDIMNYNEDERNYIMVHLIKMKAIVEKYGVQCIIEGAPGDPA